MRALLREISRMNQQNNLKLNTIILKIIYMSICYYILNLHQVSLINLTTKNKEFKKYSIVFI